MSLGTTAALGWGCVPKKEPSPPHDMWVLFTEGLTTVSPKNIWNVDTPGVNKGTELLVSTQVHI